jgi:hypothetical protein
MPKSPEGSGAQRHDSEVPEWVRNIKVANSIYEASWERARKETGESGQLSSEGSDAPFSNEARWKAVEKFYNFTRNATEALPEVILLQAEEQPVRLGTPFGTKTYGNPFRRYYVPFTDEIYSINMKGGLSGKPNPVLFPENENFPGIEAIRQDESLFYANFSYLVSEPRFDTSGREIEANRLTEKEIEIILKNLNGVFQQSENIALLERTRVELAALKVEKEEAWRRLVHEHAEILKRRMQNLVNAVKESGRGRIPEKIDIIPLVEEDKKITSDVFYMPAENKLVAVPRTTRKTLLGNSVRSHDFKQAKDAPENYWLQQIGHTFLRETFGDTRIFRDS